MAGELLSTTGIRPGNRCRKNSASLERGVTLVETMVAALILIILILGLMPVFILGFQATEQQGDIATRTTEYAQDKIESLLNLSFTDNATDTTFYPPHSTGGTGLGDTTIPMAPSSQVGAVPPAAPVTGYVDYLDLNGNLLTSSTGAYYRRQWSISTDSTATLKTITVVVSSLQAAGVKGLAPSTTLVCIKSSGL